MEASAGEGEGAGRGPGGLRNSERGPLPLSHSNKYQEKKRIPPSKPLFSKPYSPITNFK